MVDKFIQAPTGLDIANKINEVIDNLNSEGTSVTTDQIYNPQSNNPQSGIAISNAGFITGISSSDIISALGYTPYNSANPSNYITSSNSLLSSSRFDGQWVSKISSLSTATAASTYTCSLSSYLPSGTNTYEVIIAARIAYSSANANMEIGTDIINNNLSSSASFLTVTSSGNRNNIIATMPVGSGKYIKFKLTAAVSVMALYALGYRRLGTNS